MHLGWGSIAGPSMYFDILIVWFLCLYVDTVQRGLIVCAGVLVYLHTYTYLYICTCVYVYVHTCIC